MRLGAIFVISSFVLSMHTGILSGAETAEEERKIQTWFGTLAKAHNSGDWEEFVEQASPEWKKLFFYQTMHDVGMRGGKLLEQFKLATEKWDKAFEQHCSSSNLESLEDQQEALLGFKDHEKYLAAMLQFSARWPRPSYAESLRNLVIDKRRATALVDVRTHLGIMGLGAVDKNESVRAAEIKIFMIKRADRWFLATQSEWNQKGT